ncbi:MAG: [FeFe] hydrogenase H-cluster radical SAM maturase HydE [Ignavibacteriales bacterium]
MNTGEMLEILKILVSERGHEALFESAAAERSRSVGDCVHLRGIVEFSNYCRRDCLYCGLRRSNTALPRYRMTPEEIVDAAVEGAGLGLGTIVLQSGEDPWYTAGVVADIVSSIKERAGVAVTLSLGERERHEYALWRQAGADRYLLKHETSDEALYWSMRPGCRLRDRLQRLEWLGELGYEVGSGIIIGLPGQALETIAGDIAFLRDFGVHMAAAGPFIPHAGTPLGNCRPGDVALTLRITAIMRLGLPWANIPATSALGTLDGTAQAAALSCGANVLMPDITPTQCRQMYEIYPGKVGSLETPAESVARCRRVVESAGLAIGTGPGGCARRGIGGAGFERPN